MIYFWRFIINGCNLAQEIIKYPSFKAELTIT
jgi:hypothetical protein